MSFKYGFLAILLSAMSACSGDARHYLLISDDCGVPGEESGSGCETVFVTFEVQRTESCGWHLCSLAAVFVDHQITVVPGSECTLAEVTCSGHDEASDHCTATFITGDAQCGALIELTTEQDDYLSECWVGSYGASYAERGAGLHEQCDAMRAGRE